MARAGPRKVQRYSLEFKLKAVKLSQLQGVEVQAVADALEIYPFMLSKWRKEAREGTPRLMRARLGGQRLTSWGAKMDGQRIILAEAEPRFERAHSP
jgi:transposase